MSQELAIEAEGLRKEYKDVEALRGIDLQVPPGTVLGVLGPNGAGKTTAVRILTTLLPPSGGTARVMGFDVEKDANELRAHIGLAGQYAAVDENLTGFENLEMVGRLYHLGRADSRRSARPRSSTGSNWTRPATGWSRRTPAACAGASTWRPRWSPIRR